MRNGSGISESHQPKCQLCLVCAGFCTGEFDAEGGIGEFERGFAAAFAQRFRSQR